MHLYRKGQKQTKYLHNITHSGNREFIDHMSRWVHLNNFMSASVQERSGTNTISTWHYTQWKQRIYWPHVKMGAPQQFPDIRWMHLYRKGWEQTWHYTQWKQRIYWPRVKVGASQQFPDIRWMHLHRKGLVKHYIYITSPEKNTLQNTVLCINCLSCITWITKNKSSSLSHSDAFEFGYILPILPVIVVKYIFGKN